MKKWMVAAALCLAAQSGFTQSQVADDRLVRSQCIQCHTIGSGEPHGAGPNLYGILGRPAAAAAGFKFSDRYVAAMKGRIWDAQLLDKWLADTQALAPGNAMTYFQDDARKRKQIVEYLATLK